MGERLYLAYMKQGQLQTITAEQAIAACIRIALNK